MNDHVLYNPLLQQSRAAKEAWDEIENLGILKDSPFFSYLKDKLYTIDFIKDYIITPDIDIEDRGLIFLFDDCLFNSQAEIAQRVQYHTSKFHNVKLINSTSLLLDNNGKRLTVMLYSADKQMYYITIFRD